MISPSSSTAYSKGVIRMDPSSLCVAIFATHSPSCRNCVSSSSVSGGSLTWSSSLVPWCVTPGPRLQSGRHATPTRRGAARPRAAAPSAHDNDLSRYPQRRRRPTTAASSDADVDPYLLPPPLCGHLLRWQRAGPPLGVDTVWAAGRRSSAEVVGSSIRPGTTPCRSQECLASSHREPADAAGTTIGEESEQSWAAGNGSSGRVPRSPQP